MNKENKIEWIVKEKEEKTKQLNFNLVFNIYINFYNFFYYYYIIEKHYLLKYKNTKKKKKKKKKKFLNLI